MDVEIIRGTYAALSFKAMKAMWVIVHGWSKANSMDEVAKELRNDPHVAIMQVASGNYVYVHGNVTDAVGLAELVTSVQRSAKLSEPQVGIVHTPPLEHTGLSGMDLRIIKALSNDTRRPVNEIAEELGTTAKTVRRRLDRLMKEDLVQLSINWQPDTMGDMVSQIHMVLKDGVPNEKAAYLMIKKYAPGIIRSYTFSNVPGLILLTYCNRNAREMQDTFYLESQGDIPDYSRIKQMHECGGGIGSTGWGGCWSPEVARQEVLRTHTTGVTIKYLAEHPRPPVKAFGIDRVYRREAIDSTHTPEFEQLEGIVMDEDVSFSHLLGILKEFYGKMGFSEVRFRPGYFPYIEPSVEPEVYIEGLGWVELGGAGVFRKEVTSPFGIDHPVLAWGLGVSRVAMLRLGLKDLRLLYQSDIEWLRRTPVSIKL